ncbi:hypothetical protein EDB81DRAFT_256108 [Dactylonectria macrodidyma]|uniref:Uncharacterized protein n=1 Tax=Dactylonectria macrodidyma TaxID=307937 RepID=A0A9P9FLM8_9HYPO|nr:hypothetical protein EDB81DRAFT_256108 [Dactylonectria macrodidyma]
MLAGGLIGGCLCARAYAPFARLHNARPLNLSDSSASPSPPQISYLLSFHRAFPSSCIHQDTVFSVFLDRHRIVSSRKTEELTSIFSRSNVPGRSTGWKHQELYQQPAYLAACLGSSLELTPLASNHPETSAGTGANAYPLLGQVAMNPLEWSTGGYFHPIVMHLTNHKRCGVIQRHQA